jgi:ATP-dependent DNA ligase
MLSGDLARTAEVALAEVEEGLRRIGFALFRPIPPLLAFTTESVGEAVASVDRASVEWLDGIRIQLHRRGDEVRVYSRIAGRRPCERPRQGRGLDLQRQPARRGVAEGETGADHDLVVLGAEWGHGRREGWLSNLYPRRP